MAVEELPLTEAVRVAAWGLLTEPVAAVNGAAVAPAAMFTETGGMSRPLLLDTATDAPPAGAGLFRVTVQFAGVA